jgi:probable phosphoglycerate mutase
MLLYYIRHGDPIYEPDQLTPLGHRQAEAVAKRLALFGLDEIYSSPCTRALQTARPTCDLLGLEPKVLDFLNEEELGGLKLPVDAGGLDWVWAHPVYSEVLTSREVLSMGDAWYTHPSLEKYHFDHTLKPIWDSTDDFLASLGYEHDREKGLYRVIQRCPEKRVAIFAHENIGKILMSHILDIPYPYYASHFDMHTSSMTVIRFDDGNTPGYRGIPGDYARARVLTLSNDSHMYREGVSMEHRVTHIRDYF